MTANHDDGFTLVEVLLSVSLLTVVLGAVVGAMLVFLANGADTARRDDHSGGVAVATSYLNRDLASADTAGTSGTACSGTANTLTLSWTEWTATPAAPDPAPSGGTWTAAYGLQSYVATDQPNHPTRWQLWRWYCPPGTTAGAATLLLTGLGGAGDVSATVLADAGCPGGRVAVALARYLGDAGSDDALGGCLNGRAT